MGVGLRSPTVSKIQVRGGELAGDLNVYINVLHETARTREKK